MLKISFNGRFLTAEPTGVQRVAAELISATDRELASNPELQGLIHATLFMPKSAVRELDIGSIEKVRYGRLDHLLWEQIDLPRAARGSILVNLCNVGPAVAPNSVTMIHDAQVRISPTSYSLPFRTWYKIIQPLNGRVHRRIITVSDYSKTQLVRYGVAAPSKISVVPNGCDHILRVAPHFACLEKYGLEPGGYVLGLASGQRHKNTQVLVRAMQLPGRPTNLQLALFGSATRTDLERLGVTVDDRVRLLGKVSDAELAALLSQAHCLAFSSLTEGFGLPPLEAMQLGCPVIIAPCGALPEVCGKAALTASPEDPRQWLDQIVVLQNEPDLRADLIARGRVQARKFTWDRAARALLDVIFDAAGVARGMSR